MIFRLVLIVLFFVGCNADKKEKLLEDNSDNDRNIHSNDTKSVARMIKDTVSIEFLMGHFEPSKNDKFVNIDKKYCDRSGLYMQRQAYDSYRLMHEAALKDGVKLQIRSATRNFNYQKGIWERKWNGKTLVGGRNLVKSNLNAVEKAREIMYFSAMPGASRHHWGTDIDLNSFDNSWFERGKGKVLYQWLSDNAKTYGFVQVYTEKGTKRSTGYEEEKWHWTYLPISKGYTLSAKELLKDNMFKDFSGSETSSVLNIVKDYILGIDKGCY